MNREDIISLYEKANGWSPAPYAITMEELERFAALVASAERDRMCEQFNLSKELAHEKTKSNEAS